MNMDYEINNQLLGTPTATAPSISSAAMIVDFNASVWTARKKDRKASDDVTNMNAADKGVANVTKNLLGDCEELRAVQKFAGNVRNMHYSMTMPWSDNGSRLLTTHAILQVQRGDDRPATGVRAVGGRVPDRVRVEDHGRASQARCYVSP